MDTLDDVGPFVNGHVVVGRFTVFPHLCSGDDGCAIEAWLERKAMKLYGALTPEPEGETEHDLSMETRRRCYHGGGRNR